MFNNEYKVYCIITLLTIIVNGQLIVDLIGTIPLIGSQVEANQGYIQCNPKNVMSLVGTVPNVPTRNTIQYAMAGYTYPCSACYYNIENYFVKFCLVSRNITKSFEE